jgi:hypothetical protein
MKKTLLVLFLSILFFTTNASAQKDRLISEVQGEKNASPLVGESVRLTGIVTARLKTGFFCSRPTIKPTTIRRRAKAFMFLRNQSRRAKPLSAI